MVDLLQNLGGGLALSLIVALAAGAVVMTALFGVAAVVVLARFAALAHRPGPIAAALVVWSAAVGVVALDLATAGLLQDAAGVREAAPRTALASLLAVLLAAAVVRVAIRRVNERTLGWLALAGAALGLAVASGSAGQAGVAGFTASLLAVAALVVWRRLAARRAAAVLAGLAGACAVAPALFWLPYPARAVTEQTGAAALAVVGSAILLGLVPLAIAGLLDSRGRAEWFIAMRYLVAKRRQTFISAITAICIAGVAAGVWLIITVLSVMNGFERTWREEIIGNRAHFTVHHSAGVFSDYGEVVEQLLAEPRIEAASPFFDAEGMVRGENGGIAGIRIHGVDPARIGSVTDLEEDLRIGSLEALGPGSEDEDPGILIGSELAGALGIGEGSTLVLISPFGGPPTPFGSAPRLVRFRVVGIFKTSFFQYDEVFTYVHIGAAQAFRRAADVAEGVEVRTTDYYRSAQIAREAALRLGDSFYTVDWKQYFPAFFQALKTERVMMMILLTMIMVVAAFAIVVTLVMMIMEKSSDIAILKAMGAEDGTVERVFAIEGALIGSFGTLLGLVAGLAVTSRLGWIQRRVEELAGVDALPASVYQGISELPAELDVTQIALVIGIAMILALGGTWVPSRQAARVDPAEALRYE